MKPLLKSITNNYIVLGASSSIGLPVCSGILNDGHRVIAHSNSRTRELMFLQKKFPNQLTLFKKDFLDEPLVFEDSIFSDLNEIHGIVHCPSLPLEIKSMLKTNWSEIEDNMKIQVKSLHALLKRLSKLNVLSNTRCVVINSEISLQDLPPKGFLSYGITKIALDTFCKFISNELSNKILLNQISPSMFESNLLKNIPSFVKEQNNVGSFSPEAEIFDLVYYLLFKASDDEVNQNLHLSG